MNNSRLKEIRDNLDQDVVQKAINEHNALGESVSQFIYFFYAGDPYSLKIDPSKDRAINKIINSLSTGENICSVAKKLKMESSLNDAKIFSDVLEINDTISKFLGAGNNSCDFFDHYIPQIESLLIIGEFYKTR